MLFKIRKGKHNSKPFRFGIWCRKKTFKWVVQFHTSCVYEINGVDQLDTNKLIGVGYLSKLRLIKHKYFNRFWFYTFQPMQWTDSARFGWRYDLENNKIELLAYCYVNGNRIIKPICFCDIGATYELCLIIHNGEYNFIVNEQYKPILGSAIVVSRNFKNIKYRLGIFFGGNQPAPHNMYINLYPI